MCIGSAPNATPRAQVHPRPLRPSKELLLIGFNEHQTRRQRYSPNRRQHRSWNAGAANLGVRFRDACQVGSQPHPAPVRQSPDDQEDHRLGRCLRYLAPVLEVDTRWRRIVIRVGVPLSDVVHRLTAFLPPAQRDTLMMRCMAEESEAPLNVSRRRKCRLGHVCVWSAAIAHQNATCLGCGCRHLPEWRQPLQYPRLYEQHRAATTKRQWLEHLEVRMRDTQPIATRPGS